MSLKQEHELVAREWEGGDIDAAPKRDVDMKICSDQINIELHLPKPVDGVQTAGLMIEWDQEKGWRIYLYTPTQDMPFAAFSVNDDGEVERLEV